MARGKRANREGSVFQASDGSWRGYITLGFDRNGRQVKRWRRGKTQGEVIAKLNVIRHLAGGGTIEHPERVTLEEWLRRVYEIRRTRVKPKTRQAYRQYDKRINEHLGHVQIQKLRGLQIEHFYTTLSHLSPSVQQHVHDYLNAALKLALRHGLIDKNPMDAVDRPKGGSVTQPRVWNSDEVRRFLSSTRDHRLHAGFYLLLALGLRVGELLALQWSDIEADVLHVRRTLSLENGAHVFGSPKTDRGRRDVYLSRADLGVLSRQRELQLEERDLAKRWIDFGLVLPSAVGTPMSHRNLLRTYRRLVDIAGVPQIRLHDHRHTYITLARDAGLDAEVIANRVGHDVRMTMALYSRVTEDRKRRAALSLDDLLAKAAP